MVFKIFRKKETKTETPIKTEEYIELRDLYDKLRIRVEGLILDIELYKRKFRNSKGLKEEEEEKEKKESFGSGVLFSPDGKILKV